MEENASDIRRGPEASLLPMAAPIGAQAQLQAQAWALFG